MCPWIIFLSLLVLFYINLIFFKILIVANKHFKRPNKKPLIYDIKSFKKFEKNFIVYIK